MLLVPLLWWSPKAVAEFFEIHFHDVEIEV